MDAVRGRDQEYPHLALVSGITTYGVDEFHGRGHREGVPRRRKTPVTYAPVHTWEDTLKSLRTSDLATRLLAQEQQIDSNIDDLPPGMHEVSCALRGVRLDLEGLLEEAAGELATLGEDAGKVTELEEQVECQREELAEALSAEKVGKMLERLGIRQPGQGWDLDGVQEAFDEIEWQLAVARTRRTG